MSEGQAVVVISYFLEELTEQVAGNHVVNLPGFGLFGPGMNLKRHPRDKTFPRPLFVAHRAFRQLVRDCCPPCGFATSRVLFNFWKNQKPSRARSLGLDHQRPFKTLEELRRGVRRAAQRIGWEVQG